MCGAVQLVLMHAGCSTHAALCSLFLFPCQFGANGPDHAARRVSGGQRGLTQKPHAGEISCRPQGNGGCQLQHYNRCVCSWTHSETSRCCAQAGVATSEHGSSGSTCERRGEESPSSASYRVLWNIYIDYMYIRCWIKRSKSAPQLLHCTIVGRGRAH